MKYNVDTVRESGWYNKKEWLAVRDYVRQRDKMTCVRCGAFGMVLFWHAKENIGLNERALCPAHQREKPFIKNKFSREGAQPCYPVTTVISAFRSMA